MRDSTPSFCDRGGNTTTTYFELSKLCWTGLSTSFIGVFGERHRSRTGSLREFAARRMNVGGKGRRMPYLCEPNGQVKRVSPSIIRRKLKKGWIRATDWPDYYIRSGTPADEAEALVVAKAFRSERERYQQSCHEAQIQYNARLDDRDARRMAANAQAQRALSHRIRSQERELLRVRGLSHHVPLMALSLPRRVKPPRLVAHGRGSAVVGAFHDPVATDH